MKPPPPSASPEERSLWCTVCGLFRAPTMSAPAHEATAAHRTALRKVRKDTS